MQSREAPKVVFPLEADSVASRDAGGLDANSRRVKTAGLHGSPEVVAGERQTSEAGRSPKD